MTHSRSRLVPWLVLSGGLALAATGGILYAVDQDAILNGRRTPGHRETAALGIGVGAAGVLAAGVGVYLLLRGGGEDRSPPAVTPAVGSDGSATWIGLGGEF